MINVYHDRRFFDKFHYMSYFLNYLNYFNNFEFCELIILLYLVEHFIEKHY